MTDAKASKIIHLTDRTTGETDDYCGMKRWWYKEEGDIGIVPAYEAIELAVGKETHDDLSFVAESEDPVKAAEVGSEIILGELSPQSSLATRERTYRRAGWLVAFALYIEPRIRLQFTDIGIEDELILDRDPLWVAFTPDRLLKDRNSNGIVYREYKTTISASSKWLDSWKTAIQLHIAMKGVEEEIGQKVHYAQIMGLMKGDDSDGRLHHTYVWGYHKGDEWTYDYTKARSSGWNPAPVWEYPGGILEWVQKVCGETVAVSQFPHTPPVFLNERMLDQWIGRKTAREAQVALVKDLCKTDANLRAIHFEPRTARCAPPFGPACPYRRACWNASVYENPLRGGDYVPRIPHHEVEVEWRKNVKGA